MTANILMPMPRKERHQGNHPGTCRPEASHAQRHRPLSHSDHPEDESWSARTGRKEFASMGQPARRDIQRRPHRKDGARKEIRMITHLGAVGRKERNKERAVHQRDHQDPTGAGAESVRTVLAEAGRAKAAEVGAEDLINQGVDLLQ